MSKFTITGLLSWLLGLLLLGFQGISTLMNEEAGWDNMNITDVVDPQYLNWINQLPAAFLKNSAHYIVSMPLFVLLFCVGTLAFIINAFVE